MNSFNPTKDNTSIQEITKLLCNIHQEILKGMQKCHKMFAQMTKIVCRVLLDIYNNVDTHRCHGMLWSISNKTRYTIFVIWANIL